MDTKFEDMSKEDLGEALRQLYPSARQTQKEGESEGKPYTKQSLINIRSGINRHLQLPPNSKTWDLMQDRVFMAANRVFRGLKNSCVWYCDCLMSQHLHFPSCLIDNITQKYYFTLKETYKTRKRRA